MAGFNDPDTGDSLQVGMEEEEEQQQLIIGNFDDTERVESPSMETDLVNLDADTEELDIPDFVGNLRAQIVDDSDEEFVLDSEDEGNSDQKEGSIRGNLRRRIRAISAESLEVFSSATSTLTDKVNDGVPISVHPDPRYQKVLVGISQEWNPLSINQNVTEVDQDHCGQCNGDKTESRDTKGRSSTRDDVCNSMAPCNNVEISKATSAVTHDKVHALGSYDESQEPGESSQANALDFVDHYLSVNNTHFSPEVRIPNTGGLKSTLAPCAKGPQNMARNASLMTKVGISTFNWDEHQREDGGDFYLKNKKELNIQQERHMGGTLKQEMKKSVLVNSNEAYSRLMNEFAERFAEEPSGQLPENCSTESDAPDMLGVGLDTQIAAEAMEALLYAPPPNIDAKEHGGSRNTLTDALKGATENTSKSYSPGKRASFDLQIAGRKSKGERTSKQSRDMPTSFSEHSKKQRELCLSLPVTRKVTRGKSLTETCVNGRKHVTPKNKANEKSSKVISLKKKKEDSEKENNLGGCNSFGLSTPVKSFSSRQAPQELKTFSPIASRTRSGSSVKPSMRTEDATSNPGIEHGKQVGALQKRKKGDLGTDAMLCKRVRCPSPGAGASTEAANNKGFEQGLTHPDTAGTASLLMLDAWNWPKQRRTCRIMRHNAKFTSNFFALSMAIEAGKGNGMSVMGHSEPEGNFTLACFSSSVRRKARSGSNYQSLAGKKHLKMYSMLNGEPRLADAPKAEPVLPSVRMIPGISDEAKFSSQSGKLVAMDLIPSVGGEEEKTKDALSNGNDRAFLMVRSGQRTKQLRKRNSSRSSLNTELSKLGFGQSLPEFALKDLRRRRSKVDIRVLFSQSLDYDVVKHQKKVLARLGAFVASGFSDATHFVTDRFVRTKNMLEAMALGKPIVTHLWLESCRQANLFIDEKNYILRDAKKEKDIGFSMPVSLSHARAHPLLENRRVLITENVEPGKEMIVSLVKATHGRVVEGSIWRASMEYKKNPDDLLILSCKQDYQACIPLLDEGAAVYSSELLLNGIIIQKLEYEKHRLFKDHVKMNRYTRRRKKDGNQHV